MKICITAAACLITGLWAPRVHAVEKLQRGEHRSPRSKNGVAPSREPRDIASKMLSEFDTDGDGMLNVRELTVMFDGMREWLQKAKVGQGRIGQSRAGKGRPEAVRGGPESGSARSQSKNERAREPKSAEYSSEKLNKFEGQPAVKSPKKRARGQSGVSEPGERYGGVRSEPNIAQSSRPIPLF